ncbi:MAG TPA: phosphoribosylaminoimidazolesuccinocarboxamide synthase, partial [Thermoplasmatales archaeon]|nr:phosphoribosylaminoimidazolesuccinocarboxamide synthase [Thermoplasmatales archaeon]
MPTEVVVETNFSFGERRKGKVRDIYNINDKLLIIATDRLSAFDYV